MIRIFFAAAAIVAAMIVIKDGRLLAQAGLLGSCSGAQAPAGQTGAWEACRPGKLEGRPDLSRRSCTRQGVVGRVEYWRCPAPVGSGPKA